MSLASILFPSPPRAFRGRRTVKILLRGVHVACAGALFGAYVSAGGDGRAAWTVATAVSGLALLSLDLHESGAFLLEVRGLVVAGKLALFLALPLFGAARAVLLGVLVVGSVASSHAPASFRHRLLFGSGRIDAPSSRG